MGVGTAVATGQGIYPSKMNLKLEGFPIGAAMIASGGFAASTTIYTAPFVSALATTSVEANRQWASPFAGTLKNLYVRTAGAQPGTGSLVFTVRKNGVDTGITATVAAGGAAQTVSDTTHSVSVSVGDLISLKVANNATGTSAVIAGFGLEMVGGTVATSYVTGNVQPTAAVMNSKLESFALGAGHLNVDPAFGALAVAPFFNVFPATDTTAAWPAPFAGTLKNLYVKTGAAQDGSGSLVVTIYKNGVATAIATTVAANAPAATYTDLANTVTVVASDRITFHVQQNGGGGGPGGSSVISGMSLEFAGGETGTAVAAGGVITAATLNGKIEGIAIGGHGLSSTVAAGATTDQLGLFGTYDNSATEAWVQWPVPFAGTLKNLRISTLGAQPTSKTLTAKVRVNGVDSTILVTIAGDSVAGIYSDTTHSIAVVAGDLITIRVSETAGAASAGVGGYSLDLVG